MPKKSGNKEIENIIRWQGDEYKVEAFMSTGKFPKRKYRIFRGKEKLGEVTLEEAQSLRDKAKSIFGIPPQEFIDGFIGGLSLKTV